MEEEHDTAWRVLVHFAKDDDARALGERLTETAAISAAGGSISVSLNDVFVYAPTSEAIEQVARHVRAGADALGIEVTGTTVGEWIPGESRWSSEAKSAAGGDSSVTFDGVAEIITSLIFRS